MWYKSENCDNVKPDEIDIYSSKTCNYIRKDFKLIPATDDKPEHYEWLEQKVKKEDWDVYSKILSAETSITDIELAICDLYEMLNPLT